MRKLKRQKIYYFCKDNFRGADLADMQLISKHNRGIRFLICAIDLFSKYELVVTLKDKKGVTIVNAFQSILDYSEIKNKQNMGQNQQKWLMTMT